MRMLAADAHAFFENQAMQDVLRHAGYPYRCRFDQDLAEFWLDISPT